MELFKTIAVVTATANPEQAQRALNLLIEEMFPEQKIQKKEAVDKALEIMELEQKRTYMVTKTGQKKHSASRKIAKILSNRRRR